MGEQDAGVCRVELDLVDEGAAGAIQVDYTMLYTVFRGARHDLGVGAGDLARDEVEGVGRPVVGARVGRWFEHGGGAAEDDFSRVQRDNPGGGRPGAQQVLARGETLQRRLDLLDPHGLIAAHDELDLFETREPDKLVYR